MALETSVHATSGPLTEAVARTGADAVAIPVRSPGPVAEFGDAGPVLPADMDDLFEHFRFKGEPGEIAGVPVQIAGKLTELLLMGVGDGSPAALRKAGAVAARRSKGRTGLLLQPPENTGTEELAALVEGALLASYSFTIVSEPGAKRPVPSIAVVTDDASAVEQGAVIARAVGRARDLSNTPSAEKSPSWLAGKATEIGAESGLTVRVREEDELRTGGFGGILAVGSGSSRPPRLIEVTYDPGDANGQAVEHCVLVGKGITFDSGGLSLKPNDNMKLMKTDMAGGAAVLATMSALAGLGVDRKVTGLVAAAENLPSGTAMRPGDVIKHYDGTTSEVLNTDAEGRLVLADALAYAKAELAPDVVVDVATLTGAAKVALGTRTAALYATDDALSSDLEAAGKESGERVWRMPLVDDYLESMESDVADIAHIGRHGGAAGSITAALFLRGFTRDLSWAHLDIAGPARATGDDAEIVKGATGFGVRLLLRWLSRP